MICNNCGTKISDDSKFCCKCGHKTNVAYYNKLDNTNTNIIATTTTTENTCSKCGNKLSDVALFCYQCGNIINSTYFDELNINKNNNNGTTYDNLAPSTTELNVDKYNTQSNNVSDVNNHSNQSIGQQIYNSPNATPPLKTNKKWNANKSMFVSYTVIIIIIVLAIADKIADTSKAISSNTNNNDSQTQTTTQEQNSEDYISSKDQALAVAQEFLDTHPLMDRKLTGNIEYEPQRDTVPTKGLYLVETIAPDGSPRGMWVDKRTGSILLSSDGTNLRDGEEVYKEMFVSNQNSDAILFKGNNISKYLGNLAMYLYDDLGTPTGGTPIDESLFKGSEYIEYDNILFLYDNNSSVKYISGNPEAFTYNGVTLNKNRDEIVELMGTPTNEFTYNNTTKTTSVHWVEYYNENDNYLTMIAFDDKNLEASFINFTKDMQENLYKID